MKTSPFFIEVLGCFERILYTGVLSLAFSQRDFGETFCIPTLFSRRENSLSRTVLLRVTVYVPFVPWSSLLAASGSLSAAAFPEVHREYLQAALKVCIAST